MPASRSFAMRCLMKGYTLKTPRRAATMEATAEQAYATIWAVVIGAAASVGTDVPRGQLWEEEACRTIQYTVKTVQAVLRLRCAASSWWLPG